MTFGSEQVRTDFHRLPLERQGWYVDWSTQLATRKQQLRIEGLIEYGSVLEVIVRITDYSYRSAATVPLESPVVD